MHKFIFWLVPFGLILALAGCQFANFGSDDESSAGELVAAVPTTADLVTEESPSPIPTLVIATLEPSTSTPTALPTETLTPTLTPLPTATPQPTAVPTEPHPLMIDVMRSQAYPGSEITFIETLSAGANHSRYIVSYQSEGLAIRAYLTVPFGEPPAEGWPIIIFNHGFIPPEQYRTAQNYVNYVTPFAAAGYIVLASDFRGHGSSEGEAIIAYRDPGYTVDVLNAIAAAKTLPGASQERIGMYGHSMGGWITLRSMVISDEIKAGVIWGGVVVSYLDLFELWRPGGDNNGDGDEERGPQRLLREWEEQYGPLEDNQPFWDAISANSYVADLSGPIQLHHATTDEVVPYVFSEILQAEADAAGVSSELFAYEGDNHNISVNFWTAMNRSVAFFDSILKAP